MNSDCEIDDIKPSDIFLEATKATPINLLPEKSRKKYETVYKAFMEWRKLKNVHSFSENVLLAYFGELSEKYKSSSLWALYSMLRSTLNINDGINIETYIKLRAFLKHKSKGYRAKKAKTFTPEDINKFIVEAPDNIYLATKVALIMGIMGACHSRELHAMSVEDFQDLGSAMLVTVPKVKSNSKTVRKFTITDHFYDICKKYFDLRPANVTINSFFLNYQKGKCTAQRIGINKFGAMGRQIARYLKLPNPEMYTGHSFRRSSTTVFVEMGKTTRVNGNSSNQLSNKHQEYTTVEPSVSTTSEGVKVGIIHPEYPACAFTSDQLDIIQRAIMKAVEKIPDQGPQVRFQDCTQQSGWLLITCADETSVAWLENTIENLQPWEGARLKLVQGRDLPRPYVFEAYIPDDVGNRLSSQEVLTRLRKMNHGLITQEWTVLRQEESGPGQIWTFAVDEVSMSVLEVLDNRPYFGFGQIQFNLKVKEESYTPLNVTLNDLSDDLMEEEFPCPPKWVKKVDE